MTMRMIAFGLALALVFSISWEDTVSVPGIGTASRFVGLAAAAAFLVAVASAGRMRTLDGVHGAAFLFVAWSGLTVFWSLDPDRSMSGFVTNVQLLVMLLLLWELFDTREKIKLGLQAHVLGAFVAVGGVFYNYVHGNTAVHERYSVPAGGDVDGAALMLALALPAAFYLNVSSSMHTRSRVLRALNYAYIPAAMFAIVLTGTRGAVLSSVPTLLLIVLVLARASNRLRLASAAVLVIGLVLALNFAPEASINRIAQSGGQLTGGSGGSDEGLTGRTLIWKESLQAFEEHPVLGVGNNAHRAAVPRGQVAHNMTLSILTETGLIGLLIFLYLAGKLVGCVRRLSGWDARFWTTQLAVVFLGGLTLSIEDRKAIWLFVGLAVCWAGARSEPVAAVARVLSRPPVWRQPA